MICMHRKYGSNTVFAACHSRDPAESTGNTTTNNMSDNTPADTPTSAPTSTPTPPEGECSNNRFLVCLAPCTLSIRGCTDSITIYM